MGLSLYISLAHLCTLCLLGFHFHFHITNEVVLKESRGLQNQNAATFGGGGDCLEVINPPPQPQPTTVTSRANILQRPAGVEDSPANTAHFLVLPSCVTFLCYPLLCVQSVLHVWCSCPMGGCWRSVTRRMAIGRRLVRPPSPSPTVGQRL